MNPFLRLLLLAATTAVAFGLLAALLAAVAYPVVRARHGRLPAATRARRIAAWSAAPWLAGALLVALCFLPSMWSALGIAADHCPLHHDGHAQSLPRARTATGRVSLVEWLLLGAAANRRRHLSSRGWWRPSLPPGVRWWPSVTIGKTAGWPHPVERPALRDHGALPTARARLDRACVSDSVPKSSPWSWSTRARTHVAVTRCVAVAAALLSAGHLPGHPAPPPLRFGAGLRAGGGRRGCDGGRRPSPGGGSHRDRGARHAIESVGTRRRDGHGWASTVARVEELLREPP